VGKHPDLYYKSINRTNALQIFLRRHPSYPCILTRSISIPPETTSAYHLVIASKKEGEIIQCGDFVMETTKNKNKGLSKIKGNGSLF